MKDYMARGRSNVDILHVIRKGVKEKVDNAKQKAKLNL